MFILCTTEIHKIPATVLSRCQRHEFRRIPVPTIIQKLNELTKKENINIDADALSLIARQATGAMRDAISMVDQLSSMSSHVTLGIAQEVLGTATSQAVIDLVEAIQAENSGIGLEIIHRALDSGTDPRQFARQIVDYLRDLLVIRMKAGQNLELTPEMREKMEKQAEKFAIDHLVAIITAFSEASTDLKANWHPGLGLELALASSMHPPQPVIIQAESREQSRDSSQDLDSERISQSLAETSTVRSDRRSSQPDILITDDIGGFVPGTPLTLEIAKSQWDRVKRFVGSKNRITAAVLNSGRLVKAVGDTIVLNFEGELLRERMMEEKTKNLVDFMLKKVYGQEINLICTVGDQKVILPNETDQVANDLVEYAINHLNGELLEGDPFADGKDN
jgi:DNA polymerase-3 subunit gamma/tau